MAGSSQNSNQRVTNAVLGVKLDMMSDKLDEIRESQHEQDGRIRTNERDIASLKTRSNIGDGLAGVGAFLAALIGIYVKPQ